MGYHIYAIGKAIRALFADRVTYVTGFAKGAFHTSNLPTLTIDNFRLERAIALKFGQW